MRFEAPLYLLALLVVPAAVAVYVLLHRARAAVTQRFTNPHLLPNVVDRSPGRLRHLPAALFLAGLCALLVGVARPHATISVPRELATVVLAIDSSRSMAATDVKPSRLESAKVAARVFLEQVPERFRVGVVGFASVARVVAPATEDRALVLKALAGLRPGEGTALGEAIERALQIGRADRAGRKSPLSVLIISDGAEMGGSVTAAQASARARRLGVPVHTVMLGTDAGVVEVPRIGGFVERIRVPPSPETLQKVAETTRGRFFEAPDRARLAAVYEDLASRLGKRRKEAEITFAFGAGGAALMLVGGFLSAALFRRLP